MPSSQAPIQVTLYTKAGCHLCDDARSQLDEIATTISYELTEIDIRSQPDIFALYRFRIPVITINETLVAEGRIDYSELAYAFEHLQNMHQEK